MDNYATHKTPAVQRWLARHPRWHVHFTPTIDGLFRTDLVAKFQAAWDAVEKWMSQFSLLDAGKKLLQTLADGIVALKDEIKQRILESLGPIGRLLENSGCGGRPAGQPNGVRQGDHGHDFPWGAAGRIPVRHTV